MLPLAFLPTLFLYIYLFVTFLSISELLLLVDESDRPVYDDLPCPWCEAHDVSKCIDWNHNLHLAADNHCLGNDALSLSKSSHADGDQSTSRYE